MAKNDYITIRYTNTCDIGSHLFSKGLFYDFHLFGVLGNPQNEHVEIANENENKDVEFTRKTWRKSIEMAVMVDEHMLDVLNFIRLCDNKLMINKANETYIINEMEVDSDLSNGINIAKIKFVLFSITNTKCCLNNKIIIAIENPYQLDNIFTYSSSDYTNPEKIPIGSVNLIILADTTNIVVERTNEPNVDGLPQGWKYYAMQENDIFYNLKADTYYQKQQFANRVVQLPFIASVTKVDTNNYTLIGQAVEGYNVGWQYSTAAAPTVWKDAKVNNITNVFVIDALTFNGSGVQIVNNGTDNIRCYLSTFDAPLTPLCYSNTIVLP